MASLGIKWLKLVQPVLLLMKKMITVEVRNLSFVLEIWYSEFDNNILTNCFLWSG